MQITISAKQQFLANSEQSQQFRHVVTQPFFQSAITHAVAEMNSKGTFSSSEMQAVRHFIDVFANLGEVHSNPKHRPVKSLNWNEQKGGGKPRNETI